MKQLKPRDKVTQRMTRDGLTLDNQTTGESANISSREAEQELRKPENLSSGWDWDIPCDFPNYCFGGPDEKRILAGTGLCRNLLFCRTVCKYDGTSQNGLSHNSRFQTIWLLRGKYSSDANRYRSSFGLCSFGIIYPERAEQKSQIVPIFFHSAGRR